MLEALDVLDPETMQPVPRDGETLGEVMFRGNVVMKGYLKNKASTEAAFAGGWFHSGDLGVIHPDGYIQLKDRSKDIIISGGENISSIEVEDALYKHPAVQVVAVVAKPDEKWGETPCAFVELKARRDGDCRGADRLVPQPPRRLQMPALRRVRGNSEDLDRQDAEIQAAGDGEGGVNPSPCIAECLRRHVTLLRPGNRVRDTKHAMRPRFRGDERGQACRFDLID